jgi:hypothetical protein
VTSRHHPKKQESGSFPVPSDPKDSEELVTVARLPREEAWLMAGLLRTEGLPAEVVDRYATAR